MTSARALTSVLLLFAPAVARAAETNGHVMSRTQFSRARIDGLLSTADLPQFQELVEFNAQVKQGYAERGFVLGDLSLFLQASGLYRTTDANGDEQVVADHDSPQARPIVALNELYLSQDVIPELNLLLGKKRVVWGSGMAFNPTDLLNPPKDPTDPSLQRTGAYMARVEIPLEEVAFSLVFAPGVTHSESGLPSRFLYEPRWDRTDEEAHFLAAARAYALVLDADVNVMLFWSNLYGSDAFQDKARAGLSFSRYFFDDYELHVEALVQGGSARQYANSECVRDRAAALGCVQRQVPLFARSRLDSPALYPRILAGTRYQFPDETMISLEYLYQADGYTPEELQEFVNALALVKEAERLGLSLGGTPFGGTTTGSGGGAPTRFSFEPLGRHYLFFNVQKPKIHNDWTVAATVIASLQDLSTLIAPVVSWSATEWLTVSATGFIPLPGLRSLSLERPDDGSRVSEYTLLPMQYRAALELKAFY